MPVSPDWKAPSRSEFPALPEDIYHVFIEDVVNTQAKAYNSDQMVDVLKFTFTVLDGEYKGRKLWKNAPPYFTDAVPGKKESLLTSIFQAVFKKHPFHVGVKEVTPALINKFIGKQLLLVVKVAAGNNGDYNKIAEGGFMKAKTELPLPEGFEKPGEVADATLPVINEEGESVDKAESSGDKVENTEGKVIDLKDIPF